MLEGRSPVVSTIGGEVVGHDLSPLSDRAGNIALGGVVFGLNGLPEAVFQPCLDLLKLLRRVDVSADIVPETRGVEVLPSDFRAGFIEKESYAGREVVDPDVVENLESQHFEVERPKKIAVALIPAFQHLDYWDEVSVMRLVGSRHDLDMALWISRKPFFRDRVGN
ncbi:MULTISPECIES: hypothetical protein [unclassified Bradyrhizobium]|uniref:hypothetical protein n=1 Tax=unclassified Bradyrhizobium TaxID=2631580 RepID=UPI0029164164|nr:MULTISPECIES: hypothetical protein [unclassified Bradyrhizobium]